MKGLGVHSIPVYRGEGNNLAINEGKKKKKQLLENPERHKSHVK